MNREIRKRQKDFRQDSFLLELDRMKQFTFERYPASISACGDKITVNENQQARQTIVWIDHHRKVYIDEDYPDLVEDLLYAGK